MGLGWHGIERKVSTLLALGKHACTVGLGGAVEGSRPSGTLSNRSEALLRRGESRAELSGTTERSSIRASYALAYELAP